MSSFSSKNSIIPLIFISVISVFLMFGYQNCSKTTFSQASQESQSSQQQGGGATPPVNLNCQFNGRSLANGQIILAYQNSSVNLGQECRSELRKCSQGVLSGSFNFASCGVNQPKSCLFNGRTLSHNEFVTAYRQSSVSFGQSCEAEKRTCLDGVLQGSFNFQTCNMNQPASCIFNGRTLQSGESVRAYEQSAPSFGGSCTAEVRQCNDGVLSGKFSYNSCTVGAPAMCLFNGRTLAHGESVQAFNENCDKQTRQCSNGVLSGSYSFDSCQQPPPQVTIGCSNVSNISADMNIVYEKVATGQYDLTFGTFADNYWASGQYDRKMVFKIDNLTQLRSFFLARAAYDDWQWIKINDQTVYVGPVSENRRMSQTNGFIELQIQNGKAQTRTDAGNFDAELSTSWDFSLQLDLKSYLKEGYNTIWSRTIVDGGGENALRFSLGVNCSK